MKTKFFTLIVMAIGILASTSAFAANEQDVSPGQTVTYSVANNFNSYDWKVYTDNAQQNLAAGADYSMTVSNNSVSITWLAPAAGNTYYVTVQGTDATGCLSEPTPLQVDVSSPLACIADGENVLTDNTIVTHAPTGEAADGGLCSLIATSPATTGATTSGTAIGDETTFYATLTNATPGIVYAFTYTVGSNTAVTSGTVTADANGEAALPITIDATQYPNDFFADTADKNVTITVTGLVVGGETLTNLCADNSYAVKVNQIPVISFQ